MNRRDKWKANLRKTNEKLRSLGFTEAREKQFLFLKSVKPTHEGHTFTIMFFADMRAKKYYYRNLPYCWVFDPLTKEDGSKPAPEWIVNRFEREMLMELKEAGIETDEHDYFDQYLITIEDGFCKKCGLDFKDDGFYCGECAKEVEREKEEQAGIRKGREFASLRVLYDGLVQSCQLCSIKLTNKSWLLSKFREYEIGPVDEMIPHHIRYSPPEIMMPVCRSCHAKIELGSDPEYTKYRAVDKRPPIGYRRKTKDVLCSKCGIKCRVDLGHPDDESYTCYKCRRKGNTLQKRRSYPRTAWEVRAFRAK